MNKELHINLNIGQARTLTSRQRLRKRNVIVWDGLIEAYNVVFGKNMRKSFREEVDQAIEENKIITRLI